MNSKKPVEMFMENMYDFGEKILRRDENFFKKDEFVNNAESISGKMGLITYWDSINARQKILFRNISKVFIFWAWPVFKHHKNYKI